MSYDEENEFEEGDDLKMDSFDEDMDDADLPHNDDYDLEDENPERDG